MLTISRLTDEYIVINDNIVIWVKGVQVNSNSNGISYKTQICIEAPLEIKVVRGEIYDPPTETTAKIALQKVKEYANNNRKKRSTFTRYPSNKQQRGSQPPIPFVQDRPPRGDS